MEYKEIKDLSLEELKKRTKKSQQDLFELKMKHSLGQLNSPIVIRDHRRDLARLKTALNTKKG